MADEQTADRAAETHQNDQDDTKYNPAPKGLQNFITEQYQQQKAAGGMEPTAELDEERMANFFNRALKESQRMSQEVQKSTNKLQKLKAEFGEEMIEAWRDEHAAEVLTPPEHEAVRRAERATYS